eukprot:768554-Hanusia_phi.AAC.7
MHSRISESWMNQLQRTQIQKDRGRAWGRGGEGKGIMQSLKHSEPDMSGSVGEGREEYRDTGSGTSATMLRTMNLMVLSVVSHASLAYSWAPTMLRPTTKLSPSARSIAALSRCQQHVRQGLRMGPRMSSVPSVCDQDPLLGRTRKFQAIFTGEGSAARVGVEGSRREAGEEEGVVGGGMRHEVAGEGSVEGGARGWR